MELQDNMEQEQEQNQDDKVKILGYYRSRKELFINGLIFTIINAGYSIFNIFTQLPEGFEDNPELLEDLEFQPPSTIITVIFMLIGYILIDRAVFGSDVKKLTEKYGVGGYFLRKFTLALAIVFVYLMLQVITLLFIL